MVNVADALRARLRTWLGIKATTYPAWATDSLSAEAGMPLLSAQHSQADTWLWSSWVVSAISIIAQTINVAPLQVQQMQGDKRKEIENHPLELLLADPNPLDTESMFREEMLCWRMLTGNCYVWLNRGSENAPPAELWILPSHEIQPHPNGRLFIDGYRYTPAGLGEEFFIPTWQIMHWRAYNPRSRFVGASLIETLASAVMTDRHQARWNEKNFGKEQGKVPGILAFPDPIADAVWARMQAEFYDSDKVGVRRHVQLMRNIGTSTPKWVPTYTTPAEMEFMESRQWNMQEIFAVLAPGLYTMLSENSTEANSRVGKEVFTDHCWGLLTALAQRLSKDVLPAYGDNLALTFEDIRMTDRAMELREQELFAVTHTVDEIREHYYEDAKLGDERGQMLPAQISSGTRMPGDEPEPVPAALQPFQQGDEQDTEDEPDTDEQPPEADEGKQGDEDEQAKALILDDLRKWRRKAKRDPGADFDSAHIPDWQAEAIKARLAVEPETAFDPFLKAPSLQARIEALLRGRLAAIFASHQPEILAAVRAGRRPDLEAMYREVRDAALTAFQQAITDEVLAQAAGMAWGLDYGELTADAMQWAAENVSRLTRQLSETDRRYLDRLLEQLAAGEITEDALESLLAGMFGERRADTIATTEITGALQRASDQLQADLAASGIQTVQRWLTAEDERVCPVCGPLDHTTEDTWREVIPSGPPAHVRCRCRTAVETIRRRR